MRILITGAGGFIGSALVRRLLAQPLSAPSRTRNPHNTLILIDRPEALARQAFSSGQQDIRCHPGDMTDARLLRRALADGVDVAFHLASLPGGAAERDQALGRAINLDATLELFEQLAEQSGAPRVVFASSIAVYGTTLPACVDAGSPLHPPLTYGAHKRVAEILLADFTRRGKLDGIALRLPGIVARPPAPSGLASAFMSDIIRHLAAGQPFVCPVSPAATSWWMSVKCCADNLVHAARLPAANLDAGRAWPLPVLHLAMADVVAALALQFGMERADLVRYEPVESLEAVFGRYPPLDASAAEALGFRHDGDVGSLIGNALATYSQPD